MPKGVVKLDHAWYWCRGHARAEYGEWTRIDGCQRVGPVATEAEATMVGYALPRISESAVEELRLIEQRHMQGGTA